MPLWVGAGIYSLLLLLGPQLLNDPDTYSHVAFGRWIIAHRTVPFVDPFTHTAAGMHWVAFEWLSQVMYAAAHVLGGWSAVVVLAAGAVALSFALLTRFLLRELAPNTHPGARDRRVRPGIPPCPGAAARAGFSHHGDLGRRPGPRCR